MLNVSPQEFAAQYRRPQEAATDRLFKTASKEGKFEYFSAYQALCHTVCTVWAAPGIPIQFDDDHLTRQGSVYLAKQLGEALF